MTTMVKVNNVELNPIVWNGERVITCTDIDRVHNRASGTASRNFIKNRHRLVIEKDYYKLSSNEIRGLKPNNDYNFPRGAIVFTKSGYLMIVKSLNDDRAWEVQRQLVNAYFTLEKVAGAIGSNNICKEDKIMGQNELNLVIAEMIKQQMFYMENEQKANADFKQTMLQSLATLSGMVIRNCQMLNEILACNRASEQIPEKENETPVIEEKIAKTVRTPKVESSEYKAYKKKINELCWNVVSVQPDKFTNISDVKKKACDILNKTYGLCLAQDRRDYYREFGKMPSSTLDLMYWKENTNKNYKNLLSSVLENMANKVNKEELDQLASFPCVTLEEMEIMINKIGRKYKKNGINNVHFYRKFFTYLNSMTHIDWDTFEKEYRDTCVIKSSDRVSKVNMLKANKTLVELCLPYFNKFVEENYSEALR